MTPIRPHLSSGPSPASPRADEDAGRNASPGTRKRKRLARPEPLAARTALPDAERSVAPRRRPPAVHHPVARGDARNPPAAAEVAANEQPPQPATLAARALGLVCHTLKLSWQTYVGVSAVAAGFGAMRHAGNVTWATAGRPPGTGPLVNLPTVYQAKAEVLQRHALCLPADSACRAIAPRATPDLPPAYRGMSHTVGPLPDPSNPAQVFKFAMSFDAFKVYGCIDVVAKIAQEAPRSTLEEVRAELFFKARASRHSANVAYMETYKELLPLLDFFSKAEPGVQRRS